MNKYESAHRHMVAAFACQLVMKQGSSPKALFWMETVMERGRLFHGASSPVNQLYEQLWSEMHRLQHTIDGALFMQMIANA